MRKLLVIITVFIASYAAYHYIQYLKTKTSSSVAINIQGQPSMGDGQVIVVTFQDFRCPGCKYFYDMIYPELKKRYIDQGKIRYVVIPLAFLPGSRETAHTALAVQSIGDEYFFAYIALLYSSYQRYQTNTKKQLLQKATLVPGLDTALVRKSASRLDSRAILTRNFQTAELAMDKKVATPGVFVDGVDISDYSLREMIRYIDRKVWEKRAQ